jgi:DNA invertase Pin-like site-specific DNA recombinase
MLGIYERVSSKGQNLAGQHAELEAYTKDQPARWYQDTFTGKTMDRPGFNALLADIRAGKIKRLVVWRLDRLGRTASGLTALFDELNALGCVFVSMKDGIDLSTASGRLIANVLASVASFETEVRSERQRIGIDAAKASGKTWGGRKPGQAWKVTPEKTQAILALRSQGSTLPAIAKAVGLGRGTVCKVLAQASA